MQHTLYMWSNLKASCLDNTNGAAAKVMMFVRLGKKVRPGTFGEIAAG